VFDPPGSTSTIVTGVNTTGAVAGWSFQGGLPLASFIRAADGKFASFQIYSSGKPLSTYAQSISSGGDVAGYYYDPHGVQTGFIRAATGKVTKIRGPIRELRCLSINDSGDVVGDYWTGQRWAGFVRAADGATTIIDPPGASYTSALAINNGGFTVGQFTVGSGTPQGFLLSPDGTFTNITPPDLASWRHAALYLTAINAIGQITGQYETQTSASGYLRAADGAVTLFNPPDAHGTLPISINDGGAIAGYFDDANYVSHGFVRGADGRIEIFDPPGSLVTTVGGINTSGAVAGWFTDSTTSHGYIRTP